VILEQLPVPGGADRKDGEGLSTRVCSDRARGNGSKLKRADFNEILGRNSSPWGW